MVNRKHSHKEKNEDNLCPPKASIKVNKTRLQEFSKISGATHPSATLEYLSYSFLFPWRLQRHVLWTSVASPVPQHQIFSERWATGSLQMADIEKVSGNTTGILIGNWFTGWSSSWRCIQWQDFRPRNNNRRALGSAVATTSWCCQQHWADSYGDKSDSMYNSTKFNSHHRLITASAWPPLQWCMSYADAYRWLMMVLDASLNKL